MSGVDEPGQIAPKPKASPWAKLAIDFGPLLVFFLVNGFAPVPDLVRIFYATGAFMVAMLAAMLFSQMVYKHISPLLWFSGAMVVVLGGITLWLHNETFIKVKPTIYYCFIAALLFFGLYTRRNFLEMVLGSAYPGLTEKGWRLLTRNWALFFLVMALVNEAVWRNASTDFWVGFKLWGAIPATLLFAFANLPMLMKHGLTLGDAKGDPPVPPAS
jgi:intracellular septation protein